MNTVNKNYNVKVEKLNLIQGSNEWLRFRNKYIGASEIGALINIDKYSNPKELLFKKLGYIVKSNNNNTFLGKIFEKDIIEKFKYYDYDINVTYDNILQNKVVRDVHQEVNAYILYINDVPFIVSPDAYTYDNGNTIPVEIKFMDVFSLKNNMTILTSGVYAWQSLMQQIVYNSNYGYIFALISNKEFVLEIVRTDTLISQVDMLIEKAQEFYSILNKCLLRDLDVQYANSFYKEHYVRNIKNISDDTISSLSKNIDDYIIADEEDNKNVEMYIKALHEEKEARKIKEMVKNMMIMKYGNNSKGIITNSNKVILSPKFDIRALTDSEIRMMLELEQKYNKEDTDDYERTGI